MFDLITSLTVIFVTASAALFLFDRLKHPTIPAYIISGMVISPLVAEPSVISLAELGIAFLVFIFGSSLQLEKEKRTVESNVGLTLAQVGIIAIIVYAVAFSFGFDYINSIYLAVAASLSSSLVGLELIEGGVMKQAYKRLCKSINLIQDLIGIFILLLLASLPLTIGTVASNVVVGGLILLLGLVARPILPLIIESLQRSRESSMLIAISALLFFMALSQYLGITIIIGAFAAGLALSKSPYDQVILGTVEPLKDFFATIFFVSLGALVFLPNLEVIILSIALVFVICVARPALTIILIQLKGYSKGTSYMTSLNMDHVSEFALILVIHAYTVAYIEDVVFQAIILAAVISMIASSYTSRYVWDIYEYIKDYRIFSVIEDEYVDSNAPENIENHFVIGGYDIQGKELANFFTGRGKNVVVIDNDPERILEAKENGINYVYGDMMIDEVWEEAGYEDAEMIILTAPVDNLMDKVVNLDTKAYKIIRAQTVEKAKKYLDECIYVMVPHFLATDRLIEHLEGSLESESYRKRLREMSKRELSWFG